MLKKSITFTDFNGDQVTEDHYFHLSKADLVEMEVSHSEGLSNWLTSIAKSNDGKMIISELKKLILAAYGVRSDDGKRFIKNEQLREEFASSEAYSTLFLELCTNADAAGEFVQGIVPAGLAQEVQAKVPRTHPSDTAAQAPPEAFDTAKHRLQAETKEDPGLSGGRNVFENHEVSGPTSEFPEAKVISEAEARTMDWDDLRSGLATGRYRLQ